MPRALLEVIASSGQPRFVTPFVGNVAVTYVYNGIGSARLTVAPTHPQLAAILDTGQLYRIYLERFPTFPCSLVEVRAGTTGIELGFKSAEYLLQKKVARQSIIMTASTAAIAYEVVSSGLRNTPVPLSFGEFSASKTHFVELNYPDVYEIIDDLTKKDDAAFWVDSDFRVNVRDRRGLDKSQSIALYENVHLSQVSVLLDYTEVVTHIVATGKSSSDGGKPIKTLWLPSSSHQGRAAVVDFSSYTDASALVAPATQYLRDHRGPRINVDATLLDVGGMLEKVDLGDIVTVVTHKLPGAGDYRCRVVGLETTGTQAARIVFQVLPEPSYENAVEWRLS